MTDAKTMEAAVHEYVAAFDAGSPERVAALFSDDASVEDPVGTEPKVGQAAILEFYIASMQTGAKLRLEGPIRVCGPYAAFAFSVLLNLGGKDMHVDVIDTFKFNDDGKVVEMRAYFGPTNMHGFS
ncbi:steroid Delta-isomerase [Novosphingobium taihuense]|uniref:Steroid delta-isomerase n=1 Tax=Novosphingobium taihuense TaxID=260085 RepID=A0A7W7ABF5_9SPHN|nr:steroid Delta-isomerase [Novosphingobium taihuense]MBB4613918.1 steroid delta-isomerase [Novosphingobium taihuense]TWH86769.1 steroid delta-isomerase [Novosphingobium taihuense]